MFKSENNMKIIVLFFFAFIMLSSLLAQNQGIINNAKSPHVTLRSIDIGDCIWTEGFWADKFKVCEESLIPYMGKLLTGDKGHALNNFKIAAGLKEGQQC